jgi:hypothetical protein
MAAQSSVGTGNTEMCHERVGHAVYGGARHGRAKTVIEGSPRTAANEIAEYLERHQYDLSPALRIELARRHVCV